MRNKRQPLSWSILSLYKSELYGLTILWIMIFHSYLMKVNFFKGAGAPLDYTHTLVSHGNMGVDIFLFLSGIFCFYSFSKKPGFFEYERKRYSRLIIPLLLINGGYWISRLMEDGNIVKFILRVTMLDFWATGDSQIWFVSLIWVCYLLYPLIFRCIYTLDLKIKPINWFVLIGVVVAGTFLMRYFEPKLFNKWEIAITRIPVFIIGCGFGWIVKEKKKLHPALVVISMALIPITLWIIHDFKIKGIYIRYFYIFGIAYLITAAFILYALNFEPLNKFLRFFGNMSLQLYLTHILLRKILANTKFYHKGNPYYYFMLLAVSVGIAFAAYLFEEKVIRRKKKLVQ